MRRKLVTHFHITIAAGICYLFRPKVLGAAVPRHPRRSTMRCSVCLIAALVALLAAAGSQPGALVQLRALPVAACAVPDARLLPARAVAARRLLQDDATASPPTATAVAQASAASDGGDEPAFAQAMSQSVVRAGDEPATVQGENGA